MAGRGQRYRFAGVKDLVPDGIPSNRRYGRADPGACGDVLLISAGTATDSTQADLPNRSYEGAAFVTIRITGGTLAAFR